MQKGKSPHSGCLGTVEEDGGEVEKDSSTGEGTLELDKWDHVV